MNSFLYDGYTCWLLLLIVRNGGLSSAAGLVNDIRSSIFRSE